MVRRLPLYLIVIAEMLLGSILNRVVINANGGMPVPSLDYQVGKWVPMTEATRLKILGDILPFHLSIGDVIIILSIALFVSLIIWSIIDYLKKKSHLQVNNSRY